MRQRGIAALALVVGLLLAGCQSGAECNLVFENSDSAVGQVELVQEGASRTTCSADGSAMAPGEGVGFLLDPDDGPVTLRVWDPRGRRVLAEGRWDLDFSGGAVYTVTLRDGRLTVDRG